MLARLRSDLYISIHALRGEGDPLQSLPPSGRIISIHALRGEGDAAVLKFTIPRGISIHALRGEGDIKEAGKAPKEEKFLSTPSVGRATTSWL